MSEENLTLINRYRPSLFKHLIGQDHVVRSLKTVLENKTARAFIFVGQAGLGKTTTARIIAKKMGVEPRNITEVDAASNSGIDAMREVTEGMRFAALGGSPGRMYIIDEAHRLSAQAWDSLLKSIEEPPAHLYWALCTTNPSKIPEAIKTRCQVYHLKLVAKELIFELLKKVKELEPFETPEEILYLISERCGGSPRRALSFLAQCSGCTTRKEAASVLPVTTEDGQAFEICQLLAKGATWASAMELVKKVQEDIEPEGFRYMVVDYFTKAILDAKDETRAQKIAAILQAFSEPYPQGATLSHVILSLATLLL